MSPDLPGVLTQWSPENKAMGEAGRPSVEREAWPSRLLILRLVLLYERNVTQVTSTSMCLDSLPSVEITLDPACITEMF